MPFQACKMLSNAVSFIVKCQIQLDANANVDDEISQERAQCRMVMVQDGPYLSAPEKPLRIMGDSMRTQRGKDLVQDLLTEKELEVSGNPGDRNWKVKMGETHRNTGTAIVLSLFNMFLHQLILNLLTIIL